MVALAQASDLADYMELARQGQPAMLPSGPRGTLPKVCIFAVGTYDRGSRNEVTYTVRDLDELVNNHNLLCTGAAPLHMPTAVIGHEENQAILDRSDLPCAGVVTALWREGSYLYATFENIPEEVARWIAEGQLRWVSAEVYNDLYQAGIPQRLARGCSGLLLRRVSFLGATPPKQKVLGPIPPVQFSDGAALPTLLPRRRVLCALGGYIRCFSEVTPVEREPMVQAALAKGYSQAYIDLLSDELLNMLLQQQVQAGPAAFDDDGGAAPPTRDAMLAALVGLGQDPATLEGMDDSALSALYTSLFPPTTPTITPPAPMQAADSATPGQTLDPFALGQMADGSKPVDDPQKMGDALKTYAEQLTRTIVSQVTSQITPLVAQARAAAGASVTLARTQEAERRKATIQTFCDRMLSEKRVTPAQVEHDPKTGVTKGAVRARLERADAIKKFSDGKTELDLQMEEIASWPVIRRFGESLPNGSLGGGSRLSEDRKAHLLSLTPDGEAILKRKQKTA